MRSALEKIVYFEARSETLQADAATLRAEADALRADLASASQREVELRRRVAELEVELGRTHRDREEAARVLDAMRAERAGLMGKVLEAARIQGNETAPRLRPRRIHRRPPGRGDCPPGPGLRGGVHSHPPATPAR